MFTSKWLRNALVRLIMFALLSGSPAMAKKPTPDPDPDPDPTPTISYTVVDLGTLGGNGATALGMNSHGDVVGFADTATDGTTAFLYTTESGMIDIESLLPANSGWDLYAASDINDGGQIVGGGSHNGFQSAYRFTPATETSPAVIEDLGNLGSPWAEATAINNQGAVVGAADNADGSQRAFFWTEATGMLEVTGDYQTTRAYDINERGEIVGNIRVDGVIHAFRYTPGVGMIDLGYIKLARGGTSLGWGKGINNSGQVAGTASAGRSFVHAFRYTDTVGIEDLGVIGGTEKSYGEAINAVGDVVGSCEPGDRPFIYMDETGTLALWPLIESPPSYLWDDYLLPYAINDVGQICGAGAMTVSSDASVSRAVLLTPVVE